MPGPKPKDIMPGPKPKPKTLAEAVQERGKSFIEAACLMLENSKEPDPDKKHSNEIEAIKLINASIQKTVAGINLIKDFWMEKKEPSKKDLIALEKMLIVKLHKELYSSIGKLKDIKDELDNAENHCNWKERKAEDTTLGMDEVTITRKDTPLSAFTEEQTKDFLKIVNSDAKPKWFKDLPRWEQNLLKKRVQEFNKLSAQDLKEKPKNLGEFLGSVPATIRRYPGAANAYIENTIIKKDGEIMSESSKIRFAALVPGKIKDKAEKIRVTREALEQVVVAAIQEKIKISKTTGIPSKLPILLQTLYTPPFQPPGTDTNLAVMEAFTLFREELKNPITLKAFLQKHHLEPKIAAPAPTAHLNLHKPGSFSIDLLYASRPVNSARGFSWLLSLFSEQGRESRKTDKALAQYVNDYNGADKAYLQSALAAYQDMSYKRNTLAALFKRGRYNASAELAGLEQIITAKVGGIRIGGCVSGKDREEMVACISQAQETYYAKYKAFPSSNPKNLLDKDPRYQFTKDVADLFLKSHGRALAGANAKGSDGLKNIKDVFAKDICDQIKLQSNDPDSIKTSQQIAGLNKIDFEKMDRGVLTKILDFFLRRLTNRFADHSKVLSSELDNFISKKSSENSSSSQDKRTNAVQIPIQKNKSITPQQGVHRGGSEPESEPALTAAPSKPVKGK